MNAYRVDRIHCFWQEKIYRQSEDKINHNNKLTMITAIVCLEPSVSEGNYVTSEIGSNSPVKAQGKGPILGPELRVSSAIIAFFNDAVIPD